MFLNNFCTYQKTTFPTIRALVQIAVDNINKFAMYTTAKYRAWLKCDYLFRKCFVATNLVMSLEFNPIRCATMLCWPNNGSVGSNFILVSSTATSSATGANVAVPERFAQNEEPASKKNERARNKPSSAPKM